MPTWHYISAGFVPPYSKLDPAKLELPPPNAVTQISESIEKLQSGTNAEKPIYLCWLLHLVGDIHQPLHNCSLLSESVPEGDVRREHLLHRAAPRSPAGSNDDLVSSS